jgi:hypothetical protein
MSQDREELLDNLSGNVSDDISATAEPGADQPGSEAAIQQDDSQPQPGEDTSAAPSEADALLDALTEPVPSKEEQADSGAVKVPAKPDDKTAASNEKTPEELDAEDAELVKGLKPRAQERFRQLTEKVKESEERARTFEADISEFREMVKSTGMQPQEFAQTLEFGRLMNSGSEEDLKVALQMVEQQRELICKQLGIEAPGVNALSDFPDLAADVDNLAMTKERALEVAKYRRQQAVQQAAQRSQQQEREAEQKWQEDIKTVTDAATSYFATREKEADFPAKLAIIKSKFEDPAFMSNFVATYQPQQWFGAMKMMYDTIQVPPARNNAPTNQPIRSRPANTGTPKSGPGQDEFSRGMQLLDNLGV